MPVAIDRAILPRVKHALWWIGATLALGFLASGPVAAGGAQVGFSPQSVEAAVATTVAVDVTVANVDPKPGLGSYDLTLAFDPAVVRLDSFSDSGFITSGENVVICVTAKIDNAGGSVNAICTAIPLFGAPGVSTANAVALLHASFTTLAAGTSPLTITGSLSDPSGAAIPTTFGSGIIRVAAVPFAPSSTPAATPTATSAPPSQPGVTATLSPTPRASATPVARTAVRTTPARGTPKVAQTEDGGEGGTSGRVIVVSLLAAAAMIGVTGSALVWRRLRVKQRPNGP